MWTCPSAVSRWFWIVSGTGDYETLRGQGTLTIVVDGTSGRLIGTEESRVR